MARAPKPLFLARSSYRQRRLADAARAMPVFSAILLVLPLLWSAPAAGSSSLAADLGYLLVLWLAMIAVTALLAQGLSQGEVEQGSKLPADQRPEPAPHTDAGPTEPVMQEKG